MRDQRKADADHLRLLSIFHYVCAGLAVLGLGFLAAHYLFLHAFLDNPEMWKNQKNAAPPPREFFAIFKWFYVVFGVWLVVSGVANVLSGAFIGRRKHRTFSLVVAVLNCLHIPLGTVLGVFTIIVLLRPSVRDIYEAQRIDKTRISP
jgi:Na+-driven multidrug efflux pump